MDGVECWKNYPTPHIKSHSFSFERKLPLLFREEEVFPLFENGGSKVVGLS